MKYAAYHAAAHPEPHTILGRLLKPYCLGHLELLHAAESNFVHGGDLDWDDLALSILICERTYEEGSELIWKLRSDHKFALKHCRAMEKWGRKLKQPDIDAHCMEFANYIKAGSQTINIRYPVPLGEGGNDAPEHQLVKCHFLFNSCLTETQIMNRNWGLAKSEWMTHLALQGFVTALDDEPSEHQKRYEATAEAMPDLFGISTDEAGHREAIKRIRANTTTTTTQGAECAH